MRQNAMKKARQEGWDGFIVLNENNHFFKYSTKRLTMKIALICAETVRAQDNPGLAEMLGLTGCPDFFRKTLFTAITEIRLMR